MRRSAINNYFLIVVCLLQAACSGTRHLPSGEKLYTGANIKIESAEKIKGRHIKAIAAASVRPAPNKSYFGIRPKLWLYMAAGEDPKTGIGKWLKKAGEPPVLISSVKPGATTAIIDARLFNIGVFRSYTESETAEKKRTARVIYTSHIHSPYTVKELQYAIRDDSIRSLILNDKKNSLIKPGEEYNLDNFKKERIRLDALLKNSGYFYFNPDYLLFKADTSDKDRSVSFMLTLKDTVPENALTVYRINNVYIDQDYSLNKDTLNTAAEAVRFGNVLLKGNTAEMNIRPAVILRSVMLRKNDIWARHNYNITLNRLMSMGNFKFVQVRFSESDTTVAGYLDARILMTPMPNRTFRAEIDMISKSNDFAGPRMNFSILSRNAFGGAELLNLNMGGSFEAQLGGKNSNLYIFSLSPQAELTFPRFITPFKIKMSNSTYSPKTHLSLSFNYLKRVDYFDMRTFKFVYGYKWRENSRQDHEFNPVNVSFTSLNNESAAFTELLASNPFLKKSYEELFISGASYSFTYNEQVVPDKRMQYFLHFTAESAGNAFSLAKMAGGAKPTPDDPLKVIGSVYSQFVKSSLDARAFLNLNNKNKLAVRLFTGLARPYGNSSVLPYTRQFFSGGPNSLRGFQINSVGPGTFQQDVDNRGFLQMGGDIKLEINAEYRFNIYRFFKGALFADAGNVWQHKSNPANTGSPFMISGFMNEIAVGAGIGARVDVSFFILRFDLAIPLREPWLEDGQRWVTDRIDITDSSWRRENLVLNIAIGYPF
jgi:outer membrane protein assembly factor BamA